MLLRIIREASPNDCYLVVEDDAEYSENFGVSLFQSLDAVDMIDPGSGDVMQGHISPNTVLKAIFGACGIPIKNPGQIDCLFIVWWLQAKNLKV